jgi:peptide deformylase
MTEDEIADMFSLCDTLNGIGLAAPQISREEKIAVIVWQGEELVLRNPRIALKRGPILKDFEGCLSLPDTVVDVPRYETIRVECDGAFYGQFSGWLARVIQHEIDHLNDRTILHYLGDHHTDHRFCSHG